MEYYTDIHSYEGSKRTVVTLGKFDSLHRGHESLLRKMQDCAQQEDLEGVVFAFDMQGCGLLTNEERRQRLEDRANGLIQCPFTDFIREMEAETFIKEVLVGKLKAAHIVVGTDFRFGHSKRGDIHMLSDLAKSYDYELHVLDKVLYEGKEISSTYIRETLAEGNVELASTLLGYPYQLTGIVEHGRKLGRKLGFPTMNLTPSKRKLVPRYGVYVCRVRIGEEVLQGIGNIGVNPTVTCDNIPILEVFVFDYEGDTYGQEISVEFCAFVRTEEKFHSVEALKNQMNLDADFGREYFVRR